MQIYYIYKIQNVVNNKIYIGFTSNPNRRWSQITFKDGTKKIILGLNKFARLNNYNHKILSNINIGTAKSHKDIIGVKQIDC